MSRLTFKVHFYMGKYIVDHIFAYWLIVPLKFEVEHPSGTMHYIISQELLIVYQ